MSSAAYYPFSPAAPTSPLGQSPLPVWMPQPAVKPAYSPPSFFGSIGGLPGAQTPWSTYPTAGAGGGMPGFNFDPGGIGRFFTSPFGKAADFLQGPSSTNLLPGSVFGIPMPKVTLGDAAIFGAKSMGLDPYLATKYFFGQGSPTAGPTPKGVNPVPIAGKGKKGVKGKAAVTANADPYGINWLMSHPPGAVGFNQTPNPFPTVKPSDFTNKKIEDGLAQAETDMDQASKSALNTLRAVYQKIQSDPTMDKKASDRAKAWINTEVNSIRRMQVAEVASGKRIGLAMQGAGDAAANLQANFAKGAGQNYADAAAALKTLGEGVGAGLTNMGNQSLANIGQIAPGSLESPLAGGQSPTALPGAAGAATAMIGGAIPANNLAQQSGLLPGLGGAQNIANQLSAQIQAAGGNLNIGAQIAGNQRASDLNSKIIDAQQQYPQLFEQILNTLTTQQTAKQNQMLSMAQSNLENVPRVFQPRIDYLKGQQAQYATAAKTALDVKLAEVSHIDQLNAAAQRHAEFLTGEADKRWSASLSRALSLERTAQGHPPTTASLNRTGQYVSAFNVLAGKYRFNTDPAKGGYGPVEKTGPDRGKRLLNSPPKSIDEAYETISHKYPDFYRDNHENFLALLRLSYNVPDWTEQQMATGVGRLPGTNIVARLPIDPFYTKGGNLREKFDASKPDDHDPTDYTNPYWLTPGALQDVSPVPVARPDAQDVYKKYLAGG